MGIPSYFQHIIKNYEDVFKKLKDIDEIKRNLYLDSNSIIYDCLRTLKYNGNNKEFEIELYKAVCNKIEYIINKIDPTGVVIVAFDGVAPVAKLEQQRTRRFKTEIIGKVERIILGKEEYSKEWNKAAITPGTKFMEELTKYINKYFSLLGNKKVKNEEKLIISGAEDFGEGEHKIFEYIRKNKEYHSKSQTFIYGLDADLIMLCLNHLYSDELYLFREKPEYHTELANIYKDDEYCYMKISELTSDIVSALVPNDIDLDLEIMQNKIQDYIFMSFLLGNDFLPHNPTLNIRTHGLQILMDTYKKVIKPNKFICNGKMIYWKQLRKLFSELSENEELYMKNELKIMHKQMKQSMLPRNKESEEEYKMRIFMQSPVYNRDIECYINPYGECWRERYYEELFNIKENRKNKEEVRKSKKSICMNYLEGLEWIMCYYSSGCKNTLWKYKYHYPPLFSDLLLYCPIFNQELLDECDSKITSKTQLSYVLPPGSYDLLDNKVSEYMRKTYNLENNSLVHTYCKYLWEAHIDIEHIDIIELNNVINNL